MKVKTLLKALRNTDYVIVSESGWTKEEGFVGKEYYNNSDYEDWQVVEIKTVVDTKLFITVK